MKNVKLVLVLETYLSGGPLGCSDGRAGHGEGTDTVPVGKQKVPGGASRLMEQASFIDA